MIPVAAAEFWDAQARQFDEQPDHGLQDPMVRAAWTALLVQVLPPPPARVADLGCGTGSLTVLMAEAGHRVSGLDISPAMVALAQAKVAGAGYLADLSVGDAALPPWEPGSFDVVLARHVLWALGDPDLALARWLQLLAPGGRLVLVEGRWWTGAGMTAAEAANLVLRHRSEAQVTPLDDAVYWGNPIRDERFVVVSRR